VSASLGGELKARREAAGLTQGAVAKQLGVTRPNLSQWEAGRHRPSTEHLHKLDEIYGARGELIRVAEITRTGEEFARPQRLLYLADVFRDVADALVGTLVSEEGRPLGWSHHLPDAVPTPLSTAFVVRTLQLLDDARVDLHGLTEVFERRRNPEGWSNRPSVRARPEVTAVVLAALSRLGQLADVEEDLDQLERTLDGFARSRPFILAVVLESLLTIRPDIPLVRELIATLIKARKLDHESMVWTVDASAPSELVEPSIAHTARVTAVLRLAQPFAGELHNQVDEAVDMAIQWIVADDRRDDNFTEVLQSTPKDRTADVPINHFTSAWVIRALAGAEGVPSQRVQTAVNTLWTAYSPQDKLWAWRLDGTLPSWMTHDAVAALRLLAATSLPTPITHP
jgi:transcriptional regulator with XRE-family HTH domain